MNSYLAQTLQLFVVKGEAFFSLHSQNGFKKTQEIVDTIGSWCCLYLTPRILYLSSLRKVSTKPKILDTVGYYRCFCLLQTVSFSCAEFLERQLNDQPSLSQRQFLIYKMCTKLQIVLNAGCSNMTSVTLNGNNVLSGHGIHFKPNNTIDLNVLQAKFFIYKCKINKTIPQLHLFKSLLMCTNIMQN